MDNKKIEWPGWETVDIIGRGNFGEVYEIQRTIHGRTEKAALKVIMIPRNMSEINELRSEGYDDESLTQYFADSRDSIEGEYAVMADMKGHANIVYCDDILTVPSEDGYGWRIYIKMERLTPLKVKRAEQMTEDDVIKLGVDICNALMFCEEQHIVHRDIKPENIFMSRDGNYKLGDFGIAKSMEGTMGGTKVGTYDYMSPEVYNNRPYGTKADMYSLGIVMYWLLNDQNVPFLNPAAKRPTPSEKTIARERRFAGEQIPPPKDGSDELKAIVLKACAYDPKDRFANAREMLDVLNALRYGAVYSHGTDLTPQPAVLQEEKKTEVVESIVEEPAEAEKRCEEPEDSVIEEAVSEVESEEIPWELREEPDEEETEEEPCTLAQTEEHEGEEPEVAEQKKPKKKSRIFIWIGCAVAVLVVVLSIYHVKTAKGWHYDADKNEYYYYMDRARVTGSLKYDGDVYYFDENGVCEYAKRNIENVRKTWSTGTFNSGTWSSPYCVLDEPMENCRSATFKISLDETYSGWIKIYIRTNGKWVVADTYRMNGKSTNITIAFNNDIDFDAYALCLMEGPEKMGFNINITKAVVIEYYK